MSSATRAELVEQLRKLGVEEVTAEYDGEGDSGQIQDPMSGSAEIPPETAMAVQGLFYDVLEEHYGGWEINEGSFGRFTWDVKADSINLVHTDRIERTEEQNL